MTDKTVIQLLQIGISGLLKSNNKSYLEAHVQVMMPYCIDENGYLLNWNLKPICTFRSGGLTLEECQNMRLDYETSIEAIKLVETLSGVPGGYLYNDQCLPWQSTDNLKFYLNIVEALFTEIKEKEE